MADAIFKAAGLVQTATGFQADGVVINPQDYEALRLAKDSNGQYYGGAVAAPVFSQVVQQTLRLLGVPPDLEVRPLITTDAAHAVQESY